MSTVLAANRPARSGSSRVALACIRAVLIAGVLAVAGPVLGTSVSAPAFNSLVGQADYIVRAVVKSVRAEAESGPHGRIIRTFVELDVREVIAGTPPTPLVLRLLGGRVGNEEMVLQGAPQFKEGDEDILFIHGNGSMAYPLVAIMHGRYPIKQDAAHGRYMTRSNGQPLRDTVEVAQPMTDAAATAVLPAGAAQPMTPEQFVTQIKQTINRSSKVEAQR